MTRSAMAAFIRKIAAETFEQSEWNELMVNHYQDIPIENARRQAVEIYISDDKIPSDQRTRFLLALADTLEQSNDEMVFYFQGGPVGILTELPISDGEIGYMPYRSGSHYDMHRALKVGKHPICEYMNDGHRSAFAILGCPSYGRLIIKMN